MKNSIFDRIKEADFKYLISLADPYLNIDYPIAKRSAYEVLKQSKSPAFVFEQSINKLKLLEQRWYESLKITPDFTVYNDPYYLCDIWVCWLLYSRKYLLSLRSPTSFGTRSVLDALGSINSVLDLGCSFGYTTAGLKELFPSATVTGTNLQDSYQFKIAQNIGSQFGFKVIGDYSSLASVDLVFASEYFEHIQNPIEHLHNLVIRLKPKYLLIANGFNGYAIGHFNHYIHQGLTYSAPVMSKYFNTALKILKYKKVKTKIWNNRPALFRRVT